MNQDLISRQAILKHIEKKRQDALMIDDLRESNIIMMGMKLLEEAVRNQPSAQPEHTETHSCDYQRTGTHEWIPVSEALPEDGVTVWVTIKGHDVIRCEEGETLEQAIARISKIRWVTQGYWSEEEHGWNDPSFGCQLMVQPIAWMPIDTPEPYKGETK